MFSAKYGLNGPILKANLVNWRGSSKNKLACVAAVSFPFPGGDRISERKSGRAKEHAWGEQKFGEK